MSETREKYEWRKFQETQDDIVALNAESGGFTIGPINEGAVERICDDCGVGYTTRDGHTCAPAAPPAVEGDALFDECDEFLHNQHNGYLPTTEVKALRDFVAGVMARTREEDADIARKCVHWFEGKGDEVGNHVADEILARLATSPAAKEEKS